MNMLSNEYALSVQQLFCLLVGLGFAWCSLNGGRCEMAAGKIAQDLCQCRLGLKSIEPIINPMTPKDAVEKVREIMRLDLSDTDTGGIDDVPVEYECSGREKVSTCPIVYYTGKREPHVIPKGPTDSSSNTIASEMQEVNDTPASTKHPQKIPVRSAQEIRNSTGKCVDDGLERTNISPMSEWPMPVDEQVYLYDLLLHKDNTLTNAEKVAELQKCFLVCSSQSAVGKFELTARQSFCLYDIHVNSRWTDQDLTNLLTTLTKFSKIELDVLICLRLCKTPFALQILAQLLATITQPASCLVPFIPICLSSSTSTREASTLSPEEEDLQMQFLQKLKKVDKSRYALDLKILNLTRPFLRLFWPVLTQFRIYSLALDKPYITELDFFDQINWEDTYRTEIQVEEPNTIIAFQVPRSYHVDRRTPVCTYLYIGTSKDYHQALDSPTNIILNLRGYFQPNGLGKTPWEHNKLSLSFDLLLSYVTFGLARTEHTNVLRITNVPLGFTYKHAEAMQKRLVEQHPKRPHYNTSVDSTSTEQTSHYLKFNHINIIQANDQNSSVLTSGEKSMLLASFPRITYDEQYYVCGVENPEIKNNTSLLTRNDSKCTVV
ncbi:hypothetical protein NEHOM01_1184 [Nematocida homosporus]|uniref:uncharacterized protein n=1 Tax=Nematocida homosporus TaxID=1912981 RepID=UPI00221F4908|nr:uncharacterized protein NEHOM01_1184 [Nematocida homosporus]KAI5185961.1 hypothetical protein NEHOM01_1184 [Nematocida homosporus]